jgi:two-component system cell cycle sensor histidine kinase/response regulator CckA
MEQVLINLAVNARDAMDGGGKLTIETAVVELDAHAAAQTLPPLTPGSWVRLSVEDDGPGMDDATQLRAFEPFFTTKHPGKGTGLGLSTVLSIVKQSQGAIRVTSQPGAGARFDVYLPQVSPKAPTLDLGYAAPSTLHVGREALLVVDDEDSVRAIAARVLSDAGYAVSVAPGGVEALRLLADPSNTFELLVTDVVMPVMDGPTLAQRMRENSPDLKIIFISGYTEDTPEGPHGGANTFFLPKPFTLKQLAAKR